MRNHQYIGSIAKLLGMTIPGIKHYEKLCIITVRKAANGLYRQYGFKDLMTIINARMYQKSGFSLKDIASFSSHDGQYVYNIIKSRRKELEKELAFKQRICEKMRTFETSTYSFSKNESLFEITSSPEIYVSPCFFSTVSSSSNHSVASFRRWLDISPIPDYYLTINDYAPASGLYEISLGFCIEDSDRQFLGTKQQEECTLIPSRKSLHLKTKLHSSSDQKDIRILIDSVRTYAKENHLEILGEPYARASCFHVSSLPSLDQFKYFIDIWVPVE